MDISLPLPRLESEGFENGYRQHHEDAAEKADADGFCSSFFHIICKISTIHQNPKTIHHIFAQIIPGFLRKDLSNLPLQLKTAKLDGASATGVNSIAFGLRELCTQKCLMKKIKL